MAETKKPGTDEDSYDAARDLAEAALEKYAKGDAKTGDKLAEQAVKTDRHAVEELVEEMDEDAANASDADTGDTEKKS